MENENIGSFIVGMFLSAILVFLFFAITCVPKTSHFHRIREAEDKIEKKFDEKIEFIKKESLLSGCTSYNAETGVLEWKESQKPFFEQ